MTRLKAMVLDAPGEPLRLRESDLPTPGPNEVLVKISACGVCRTDLHIADGEVPANYPVVPGHEIVGIVVDRGDAVAEPSIGDRVGVPWLGRSCGQCPYCLGGHENLCDAPVFTGATRNGGYATHVVADAGFCLPLPGTYGDAEAAPLLCAGLIGHRSLVMAGSGSVLGLYGFGAAAHIIAQIGLWQGRQIYAFTRPGDIQSQTFARSLGCQWAGGSDEQPPLPLDAAIIFAPSGALVPAALRATRKGGRVVCAGIHMSDIPSFAYDDLWGERQLVSVANLTRADGRTFLELAPRVPVTTHVTCFPLKMANEALAAVRAGKLEGAAVLVP